MIDDTPIAAPARNRFRVRSRFHFLPLLLLFAALVAIRWWWSAGPSTTAPAPPLLEAGEHEVVRVIDGDTLLMAGDVRVRLLGVDTPETVKPEQPPEPWGAEATAFTKAFVAAGPVRLTFDRERRDRYGRQLAFVWRGEVSLNEQLIAAGLSPAMTKYPYSPAMKDRFRAAEREAKRKQLGIWSAASEPTTSQPVPSITAPAAAR